MSTKGRVYGGIGGALKGASAGSAFGAPGAIVGGAIGLAVGAVAGGDNSAEQIAERQIKLEELESSQRINDMRTQMGQVLGQGRAAIGASGIDFSGSPQQYLNMLEGQFRDEISWERMRSQLQQQIIAKGGDAAQSGYENQLLQGAIGSLSALPGLKKTFSTPEEGDG